MLKGAEVGQYEQYASFKQSEREWLDEAAYLNAGNSNPFSRARRIATQRITGVDDAHRLKATIIEPPCNFADSTNSIHLSDGSPYCLEYVLALLNSSLLQWRFRLTSSNNNVGTNELEALPFRLIDFSNDEEVERYHRIVTSVSRLIMRKADLTADRVEATTVLREISALEEMIEDEIYVLYGIAKTDRRHIENGAKPRHRMLEEQAKEASER